MEIPKQYKSLFIMMIFITRKSSHADQETTFQLQTIHHQQTLFGKITVKIINDLGSTQTLLYHCKSKDTDLGSRSLQSGESWSFTFHRQFFGRTLFFCSFGLQSRWYWFDIYTDKRDGRGDYWCQKCLWKIRQTGPCRFNDETKEFDLCYPWNYSLY
ncbi:hypothetical protein EUTSA_v10027197mg [Eutrema salsugineum]|uniref:S-protein homolog n=1 Tax=Eutrema salsugineum TaxID=72664 RepID=V4MK41_EUTSA|nr:hypothetical protein EUTSA_v10027197mg [Eutrema salsugineum]